MKFNFYRRKLSFCCRYIGQSESNIIALFKKASENPTLIFLDEVDSICKQRGRDGSDTRDSIVNTILVELDKMASEQSTIFICATNHPSILDTALVSRMNLRIEIPLPEYADRCKKFQKELQSLQEQDIQMAAAMTENFSGRDIQCLINTAKMNAQDKIYTSNNFKPVALDNDSIFDYYMICEETDPESYPMTHSDVPKSRIIVPKVDINTISNAIKTVKVSVTSADLQEIKLFTETHGIKFQEDDNGIGPEANQANQVYLGCTFASFFLFIIVTLVFIFLVKSVTY